MNVFTPRHKIYYLSRNLNSNTNSDPLPPLDKCDVHDENDEEKNIGNSKLFGMDNVTLMCTKID